MRRAAFFLAVSFFLTGCSSSTKTEPPKAERPAKQPGPKPADESRRFPAANRIETVLSEDHVLGKQMLPGGNIARYKRGAKEYELFVVKTSATSTAAVLLFDFKNTLASPRFIPHFGGFFGKDGDTDTFIFAKGVWLAGVRGLPEAEADAVARQFAAGLD